MSVSAVDLWHQAPADRLDTLPLDDLRPDGSWDVDYWMAPGRLTLAWHVIEWAEGRAPQRHRGFPGIVVPNGPRAGKPWRYTARQARFLFWWYAVDPAGAWLFHRGVRRLAKGSGKSPSAAVWCLAELCGPVRVGRIVDPDHAQPWARLTAVPVDMPLVQIAATTESQTHNTMRMVRAMASKKSPITQTYHLDTGKTQIYVPGEGKLEVITSSFTAAEGAEPSAAVADETEHSTTSNGGPDLISTLLDNLAKRSGRLLETSNAYETGAGSVAETTYEAWIAQEEGRTNSDQHILYDAVIMRPDVDLSDDASLVPELRRIYADCDWRKPQQPTSDGRDLEPVPGSAPDVKSFITRIRDSTSSVAASWRKYGNRPSADDASWADPTDWSAMVGPRPVAYDEPVVLFFDGGRAHDATALVGCALSDGYVFTLGVWERPAELPSQRKWVVDVHAVDRTVKEAHRELKVVAFAADVREWESYVHTAWPEALPVDEYLVNAVEAGVSAAPIAWDMRSHVKPFTTSAELTRGEIEDHAFRHDGNPITSRHIGNAVAASNTWGVSVSKETRHSPKSIDAAVCVIGARMMRRRVLASAAWRDLHEAPPPPKRRPGVVRGW